MKQESLFYFLAEIGFQTISYLLIVGFLFGIAFTYSHFWAIKKYILNGGAFQRKIFILTFIRLAVFAFALFMSAYPNHSGLRMMLFFAAFMIGRISMMRLAKKEIVK